MKNIIYCLLLLIIISCGKESPEVADQVISFTLTVNSSSGGGVSTPGGSFNQGQSVSITATPDSEYVFVNWSNGSTDNPISIIVNSNQTITANFEKRKYPLTLSITGSGTVSEEIISSGKTTTEYNSGSVIRLTANPSDEWEFSGWSGSVSSNDNPIELTVNESKLITATFQVPDILFINRSPMYPSINNSIGNINSLPKTAQKTLKEVILKTKNNTRIVLTLALSYGAREEIVNTIKNISKKVVNKELTLEEIDEKIINNHLYTFNLPDVDLMIRTSGEKRISNFLLWQMAYAELYFTNILWPDFRKEHFYDAIIEYQNRERRFGKTSDQITITE